MRSEYAVGIFEMERKYMDILKKFGLQKIEEGSVYSRQRVEVQELLSSVASNPDLVTDVQIVLGELVQGDIERVAGDPMIKVGNNVVYFDKLYMDNYRSQTLAPNEALTNLITKQIIFNKGE